MTLSKQKIYPIVFLAFFLTLSITACNGNNNSNNTTGKQQGVPGNRNKQQTDDTRNNGHYGSFDEWKQGGNIASMWNGKNEIRRDEFVDQISKSGFFGMWDINGNGVLSKHEWNNGIDTYFSSYDAIDYGIYKNWDKNNDGVIGKDEFDNELFNFVNRNSSQTISKEEFKIWFDWWPWNDKNL